MVYALSVAMLSVLSSPADATSFVPLSVEQLTDASDTIVRGIVVDVWTEVETSEKKITREINELQRTENNVARIWTVAQVEVVSVLKANDRTKNVESNAPAKTYLTISQPGGTWGESNMIVESVSRFSIGEEGYFFVEDLKSGLSVTTGMFQGKYNIILDPYTGQELSTRFTIHPGRTFDHRFIPLPQKSKRVRASDFEAQVKRRVAAGWDGKSIPGISDEELKQKSSPQSSQGF